MLAQKSFRIGGVHPPENKLTADVPLKTLPLPKEVAIPLAQHIGKPAEAAVARGDEVKVGTVIGTAAGFVSANVHASVAGKVKKLDMVVDPQGRRRESVIITVAEEEEWEDGIDTSPDLVTDVTAAPDEIIQAMREAGIVGAGGATFPSAVKYSIPDGKTVDTVIINGVECEPYLTADHRVMLEQTDELIVGTRILMRSVGVHSAYIGIENNKPDAIRRVHDRLVELAESTDEYDRPVFPEGTIVAQPLKVKYPQGGEKQLIQAILGREVPSGKLPLDVGCVVSNVGTTVAVYQAVQKKMPFVERVVTVTGKELAQGGNFVVRIGTPVSALVEAVGGVPEGTGKIVMGGPMTGKALTSFETPVTKGSGGLIFIPEAEAVRGRVENCIRCSRCVMSCPMGLEPYLLEKLVQHDRWDAADQEAIMDCIECGGCSFACPSNRPLLDYIRIGKAEVLGRRRARK